MIPRALPPTITADGGTIEPAAPAAVELIVFNADSIYPLLVRNKVYDIKQITEEEIMKAMRNYYNGKKNECYSISTVSHYCSTSIIVYGEKNKAFRYMYSLISSKELQTIPTLNTFYTIHAMLIEAVRGVGTTD